MEVSFSDDDRHEFVVLKEEVDIALVEGDTALAPVLVVNILFEIVVVDHEAHNLLLVHVENLLTEEGGLLVGDVDAGEDGVIALEEEGEGVVIAQHGGGLVDGIVDGLHLVGFAQNGDHFLDGHVELQVAYSLLYMYVESHNFKNCLRKQRYK